jgi:uncharacterized SAM-binding protein YcdF (DUF218 family)
VPRQLIAADRDRRTARRPRTTIGERLRDLVFVFVLFVVGSASLTAYTTFRIWQVGQQDGRRHVDAIVVLGAAQYNGRPSGVLAARLDHAIDLYKQGYAPYLITTGGNLPGDRTTEAETGRAYALKRQVPASALLMENKGGSTHESLTNVKAIMDAKGLHTALFVSDRSHMLRVLRQADDLGIEGWSSPTTTSPADLSANLKYKSYIHELGAMGLYIFLTEDPHDGAPGADDASDGSPQIPSPSAAAP